MTLWSRQFSYDPRVKAVQLSSAMTLGSRQFSYDPRVKAVQLSSAMTAIFANEIFNLDFFIQLMNEYLYLK